MVSAVKMATVLDEFATEEQRLLCFSFCGKGYSYRNVSCLRWEVFVA
jgi:hypothetical protein